MSNTLLDALRLVTVEHIGNDKIITEAKEEFCKPEGHIVPKAADEGAAAGTPAPPSETPAADAAVVAGPQEAEGATAEGATAEGATAEGGKPPTGGRRSKRRRQKKSAKKSKKGGRSRKNGSKNRRKLSRRR